MSLTDSEASAMFLQQGLQNAQLMAQQQAQLQSLCQAMHFNTIREVYVGEILRDQPTAVHVPVEMSDEDKAKIAKIVRDCKTSETIVLPQGVTINNDSDPAYFDRIAARAKLAADRLMISLNLMKEPTA